MLKYVIFIREPFVPGAGDSKTGVFWHRSGLTSTAESFAGLLLDLEIVIYEFMTRSKSLVCLGVCAEYAE